MMDNRVHAPFATDSECDERRAKMIEAGIIRPADKADLTTFKNGSRGIVTKRRSIVNRQKLIDRGLISSEFCPLHKSFSKNMKSEGEYTPFEPSNEIEYSRKKNMYFRMMQEILYSRRKLRLAMGKKFENDPEWYF